MTRKVVRRPQKGARKLRVRATETVGYVTKNFIDTGVVKRFPGETTHYEIVDNDIYVHVLLVELGKEFTMKLAHGTGGYYRVPAVGDEVVVAFRGGVTHGDATIVGVLTRPDAPNFLGTGDTFVVCDRGGAVFIMDEGTEATDVKRVAFAHELQSLRDFVMAQFTGVGHTHATPSGASTSTTKAAGSTDPVAAPGSTVLAAK